jgi:Mor family transcriptional regulator
VGMKINNYDIFKEFYNTCRKKSFTEVLKEYGGSEIYIPSYKNTHRNRDIYKRYKEGESIRDIAREFDLSIARVRAIIRGFRKVKNL